MHLKVDGDDKSYSKQDSCSNYADMTEIPFVTGNTEKDVTF